MCMQVRTCIEHDEISAAINTCTHSNLHDIVYFQYLYHSESILNNIKARENHTSSVLKNCRVAS